MRERSRTSPDIQLKKFSMFKQESGARKDYAIKSKKTPQNNIKVQQKATSKKANLICLKIEVKRPQQPDFFCFTY